MVRCEDPARTLDCAPESCPAPYIDLPEAWPEHARPIDDAAYRARLDEMFRAPHPEPLDLGAEALRDAIAEGLNNGFLLEGIGSRPLRATVIERMAGEGYAVEEVVVEDPVVGLSHLLWLWPVGEERSEPMPAVVGLHGHGDDGLAMARWYLGYELAEAGYSVLLPTMRGMDCVPREHEVADALLRSGFTLMGVYVYEALRALELAGAHPAIDPARIGVLAHSGGSSIGNLAVRLTDRVAAHAFDLYNDYRNVCSFVDPMSVHCETIPGIFPLSATLRDMDTLATPSLYSPYGFPAVEDRQAIFDFFAEHLDP